VTSKKQLHFGGDVDQDMDPGILKEISTTAEEKCTNFAHNRSRSQIPNKFFKGWYLISNKPFEFGADPDHKRKR